MTESMFINQAGGWTRYPSVSTAQNANCNCNKWVSDTPPSCHWMKPPSSSSHLRIKSNHCVSSRNAPSGRAPRLLAQIAPGQSTNLGAVKLKYEGVIPITGLQYKSDPGLPITYIAFGFIMLGVMLAAVPHRHVWATYAPRENLLSIGGRSVKAKVGFERSMKKLLETLRSEHGIGSDRIREIADGEELEATRIWPSDQHSTGCSENRFRFHCNSRSRFRKQHRISTKPRAQRALGRARQKRNRG